jgi:hypothetical protein
MHMYIHSNLLYGSLTYVCLVLCTNLNFKLNFFHFKLWSQQILEWNVRFYNGNILDYYRKDKWVQKIYITFDHFLIEIAKASGLYYKHVTIINDNSSIINKWSFKLIDDARVVIYDCNRFIIQAIGFLVSQNNLWVGAMLTHFHLILNIIFD